MNSTKSVVDMIQDGFDTTKTAKFLIIIAIVGSVFNIIGQALTEMPEFVEYAGFGFLFTILSSIIGFIVTVYIYIKHSNRVENKDVSESDRLFSQALSLIGVYIISGIATIIGFIFFIIPGIYILLKLYLAGPICIIENKRAIESLQLSWNRTSGNLVKVLGLIFLSFALSVAAITVVILGLALAVINPLLGVIGLLVAPVIVVVELTVSAAIADMSIALRPDEKEALDNSEFAY